MIKESKFTANAAGLKALMKLAKESNSTFFINTFDYSFVTQLTWFNDNIFCGTVEGVILKCYTEYSVAPNTIYSIRKINK